jgi:AraC-like DNA-binding protein
VTSLQSPHSYDERLAEVRHYIRAHPDGPLEREVLAAVAGYSVSHFHRIFTACMAENIAGYVRRVRLERAGRKLRLGAVDITELALAAGYHSHAATSYKSIKSPRSKVWRLKMEQIQPTIDHQPAFAEHPLKSCRILQDRDVRQRVAVYYQQIGALARLQRARLVANAESCRG